LAVDHRTNDCTRVCFLSHDPHLYENPLPEPLDWSAFRPLPVERPMPSLEVQPNESHAIRPDVYREILKKLETKARPLHKFPFVPNLLQQAMPSIRQAIAEQDLEIKEERDIQYGKKLVVWHGLNQSEVNIFYGKKGFSVVKVERRQANEALVDLVVFIIEQAIFQLVNQSNWDEDTPF
jgi:hypothetical protein